MTRPLQACLRYLMRGAIVMTWVSLYLRDVPACLAWLVVAFTSAVVEMEIY